MRYLSNGFSLAMLDSRDVSVSVRRIEASTVKHHFSRMPWESIVGHADTAAIISGMLGMDVPVARKSITLQDGDYLYVAQYTGPRLPEGATTLPDGSSLVFCLLTITPALVDYSMDVAPGSTHGAIVQRAMDVAKMVGGDVSLKADQWGNLVVVVEATGFYAEMRDE